MAKKKLNRYGWKKNLPDHRDFKFVPPQHLLAALPSQVDLRPSCPPVYDQGELGSCTANAIGACCEFEQMKSGKDHWTPSRLFIYYNERLLENTISEDAGAMIRDGIKTLVRWGFCPETDWPYDITKFTRKPPRLAYNDAVPHRISQYQSINQSIDDIRASLAGGNPVIFGFSVYESFESQAVAKTGDVPMPGTAEQMLGGHAVLAVGYDNSRNVLIVRNSWSDGWGDKGYFYMPYDYVVSADLASDFWNISYVP